jgi:hypothetical protein
MSEQKIEFKWLEAKCTGTDTVVFKLEDGAVVKIKVDVDRAGVATGFTNPDGTPHYEIGAALKINVIPSNKAYYIPKSQLKTFALKEPDDLPFIR